MIFWRSFLPADRYSIISSQNGWHQKGPLEATWSILCAKHSNLEEAIQVHVQFPSYKHSEEGDFMTYPGNLLQGLVTLQWERVSLGSEGTSCVSGCVHCLWVCHQQPLKRAWLNPLCTFPSGIHTHWWDSEPSTVQDKGSQLSQPFLRREMLQSLIKLCSLSWTLACMLQSSPRLSCTGKPRPSSLSVALTSAG